MPGSASPDTAEAFPLPDLPISAVLPEIAARLRDSGRVVLQAPPGAGKTTLVPLYLLQERVVTGRIVMLEPRRIAARNAAARMADLLKEPLGARVGYRMRGATEVSDATRIEVVTEGVLTRMIQRAPELRGIGCIIFDEFHERSLQADLGLALALEIRAALREDLMLVVMSATLDAGPVATLMDDAPLVTSKGRAFDVESRYLDAPWQKHHRRMEDAVAAVVQDALSETTGDMLVFLPGAGEIGRVEALLAPRLRDVDIRPLFGAMAFKDQMAALRPGGKARKVVLATAIAETSLTIPDVRVVIDGGQARRARHDPRSAMSRLVTERVTKAEAEQRRGRAGRVATGWCYRLWTRGEEGGLSPFPPVEIEDNDLLSLALELAIWGAGSAADLPFLTAPPEATLTRAFDMLAGFGAVDHRRGITAHGEKIAAIPAHPRLAHMLVKGQVIGAAGTAAMLAALLSGRDPVARGDVDITRRVTAIRGAEKSARLSEIRADIKRLSRGGDRDRWTPGAVLSLAYPDRIARRRGGAAPRFHLSGGKGALLRQEDPLAAEEWLVIADLDGDTREAAVRMAAAIGLADIRALHAAAITTGSVCEWDGRAQRVVAETQERLGALILTRARTKSPDPDAVVSAMLVGIRDMGLAVLPWDRATRGLCDRVAWASAAGDDGLPNMSDAALLADLDAWLAPYLSGMSRRDDLARLDLLAALEARLGWEGQRRLDQLVPRKFTAPTGTGAAIDYSGDMPKVSIRLQEMMGLTEHPVVGPAKTPLLIELLSPAQRPIQTTANLPGFWTSSYADVRKEMRGRYPRHHWPEDPANAAPTRRVKPR